MQIKGLHKNIYKLASYALSQEKRESSVSSWQKLKSEEVSDKTCQDILRISRATYYRYKERLDDLDMGIFSPSSRPKNLRKSKWGEAEKQIVLQI